MDKLKMQTANKADENFKKLAAMFPNAVTETIDENDEVVRAIDKDVLMQEISCISTSLSIARTTSPFSSIVSVTALGNITANFL